MTDRAAEGRRRRIGALAAAGGAAAALWAGGLVWFAETIPRQVADPERGTDAIVVVTGGPLRLRAGLALLAEGKAGKLFVSGVYRGVEIAELLRAAKQSPEAVECCIALGYAADNTEGNAAETREWMARERFASLRLVTAAFHIRRSLLEFRRAMPLVEIVPHPVFPDSFRRDEWWARRGTLWLVTVEYHKFLAAVARAWVLGPAAP